MNIVKSLLLFFLNISVVFTYAQNGAEIFKSKCTSCHSIGKGIIVGPDLKNIYMDKGMTEQWLHRFIRSSQTLIKSGDMHAKQTFEKFKKTVMPDQPLSDAGITAVIGYIKSASKNPTGTIAASVGAGPAEIHNQPVVALQHTSGSSYKNSWLAFIMLFFLAIIAVLARIISALCGALGEQLKKNKNYS